MANPAALWCALAANIAMMSAISALLSALPAGTEGQSFAVAAGVAALALVVRCFCATGAAAMSFHSSHRQQNTPPDWRGILFYRSFLSIPYFFLSSSE